MNVLVTGATAPLGVAIVRRLLAAPEVGLVLAVGREAESTVPDEPRLRHHHVDLTHAREVRDLLHGPARALAIDTVIHAAQHRSPRDHDRHTHAQNVDAVRAMVIDCADHPTIRRFVYRSFAEIYAQPDTTTSLLDEDAALEFDPGIPPWLRDRVEADLTVCAHLGGTLQIAVLRCAEILAADSGSQLWDYLSSRVCLRPAGYDPMLNVLAIDDAAAAFVAAAHATATGIFNIPGAATLPLSCAIAASGRTDIPVPGMLMAPLYRLRRAVAGFEFRYDLNASRFHFGGVLEGSRARRVLGYTPICDPRRTWPS